MKITVNANFVDIDDNGNCHSMSVEQFVKHCRDEKLVCDIAQQCTRIDRENVKAILPIEDQKMIDAIPIAGVKI